VNSKLVVIFGGETPEHEVSLCGARAVLHHAASLGWNALPVGVARSGQWLVGPGALEQLWRTAEPQSLPRGYDLADRVPGEGGEVEIFDGPPASSVMAGYQLAFPVCHGRWGEDGTVQGLLACYGFRLVGCGVTSSAVCFDKHLAKSVLKAAGLPVARGLRIDRLQHASGSDIVDAARRVVGPFPWFVKPVCGGSSLGIGRAETEPDVGPALTEAFRWDSAVLIEESVPHREMVIGVLGNSGGGLLVSPPGECIAVGPLYTYEEKYKLGNPRFTCPAEVDASLAFRARELAAEAFRALGCSVFARIDLFLDLRTDEFVINEVNTIPGLTEVSVFPKVMQAAGLSYPNLLSELCRLAREE
jgi:D-alanine-D-alanine ligase